jgi:hypothetical protein
MPKSIADEFLLIHTNANDMLKAIEKEIDQVTLSLDKNIFCVIFKDNSKLYFDKDDVPISLMSFLLYD